ncbi:hypothetical protein DFH07DRAFT_811815 [Mycena maculata]|uniref:F-box domain-containing protein n=1 Tax=Mycena maculata TaxID=230809 RepID=A0AAD7NJL3_9AGAR|nr:hypothetical protein DFH07DRAFT_811815 [Mycena maculata]
MASSSSMSLNVDGTQSSPVILSLPDELLVEIAAMGQEDRDPDDEFKSEWELSHVSRRFRHSIVGAATLWTQIEVAAETTEGSVEVFKLYLERSRACKLWLTLRDSDPVQRDFRVEERFSHFLPHIQRIWRLDIQSRHEHTTDSILTHLRNVAASSLEHLEIHVAYEFDILNVFSSGAPKLKFLKLTDCFFNSPVPSWATHLTHLELRSWDDSLDSDGNSFFMAFLTQCHSLAHLFLETNAMELNHKRIPSLESLIVVISDTSDALHLRETLFHFDTPLLTALVVQYAHGDQISVLFSPTNLPYSSFPALTSLSFVNNGCECEADFSLCEEVQPITSPPQHLFPVLSSLTLVNQCFTEEILSDILGADSTSWPFLKTVSICPKENKLEEVYSTLAQIVCSKRQTHQEQALPKLRLSPSLFAKECWEENGVDVELFDAAEVIDGLA